jgi:hypothetical protein
MAQIPQHWNRNDHNKDRKVWALKIPQNISVKLVYNQLNNKYGKLRSFI